MDRGMGTYTVRTCRCTLPKIQKGTKGLSAGGPDWISFDLIGG